MRRVCISSCVTAVFVLVLAGVSGAQPPVREEPAPPSTPPSTPPPSPTPVRPEPVPALPSGPAGPTPPGPTAPPAAKEEEPPPPSPEPIAEPRRVPEGLLPSRAPTLVPPPVFVGPNLFDPPAPQGWLSITPTFTLGV